MKYITYLSIILFALTSCGLDKPNGPEWKYDKNVSIEGIAPIGIAIEEDKFWISDGDNNRLIQLSMDGQILKEEKEFERPMHISIDQNTVYIPSYGEDAIIAYKDGNREYVSLKDSLDAPAGVDVKGNEMAIADFYNHRILYYNGTDTKIVGEKGNGDLEFHYPTDVQIGTENIYIADAYNNRIQIISKDGSHVKNIGKDQKMNAATGIFVDGEDIYITDFEHDRVLVFNHLGQLTLEINEGLEKPTDLIVYQDQLFIINYKSQSISKYIK